MKHPYTWDFYFKRFQEKGLDSLFDFSQFIFKSRTAKSTLRCKKCNSTFQISVDYLNHGLGCPYCRSSRGERTIAGLLNSWKIPFIQEKVFEDTKFRWDFWIPETKVLIEYQGEQHFKPSDFSKNNPEKKEENFRIQQKRDRLKKEWAEKKGFKILYLIYKDSFENLQDQLKDFLLQENISFNYTEEKFQQLKENYRYKLTKERKREIQRKSNLKHKEQRESYRKEWCEKNKEKLKQQREARKKEISSYMKKRYQEKKETIQKYNQEYHQKNKEKLNFDRREDRKQNLERYKSREKAFYDKNKEYYRKYAKEYYYRKKKAQQK